MPDIPVVAPQPAPTQVVQSGGEKKGGSANLSVSQYARRFTDAAPQANPPAEQKAPETPVAAPKPTEEVPQVSSSAEAKPKEPDKVEKPDPTPEEKADEALSKSTSIEFSPEQQELFNKRLGKEVFKRKELERQLSELKTRVEPAKPVETKPESPSIVPLPAGAPPLSNIDDISGLQHLQQQAKEAIRWAEDCLAAATDGEAVPENWDKRSLREVIRNAKLTLEDHIPARAGFLQDKARAQQQAYDTFPFLKDKESEQYVQAQSFYKTYPWLRNVPTGELMIGAMVEGIAAIEARAKSKDKAAPTKPTARPSGGQTEVSSDAAPLRTPIDSQNRRASQAANEKLKTKNGASAKDYASYLANKELLKNR